MLYDDIVIDSIIKSAAYSAIIEETELMKKQAEAETNGGGNPPQNPSNENGIDINAIIEAIKANPYTTGGAGLGGAAGLALGGDGIQDKILAALLGSGVGGGLGYLADNYDSILGK